MKATIRSGIGIGASRADAAPESEGIAPALLRKQVRSGRLARAAPGSDCYAEIDCRSFPVVTNPGSSALGDGQHEPLASHVGGAGSIAGPRAVAVDRCAAGHSGVLCCPWDLRAHRNCVFMAAAARTLGGQVQ